MRPEMKTQIQYIKGDLITLALQGKFQVIVHGCNCQNKMGAGIAKQIAKQWPGVLELDSYMAKKGMNALGNIGVFDTHKKLQVINAYTQQY